MLVVFDLDGTLVDSRRALLEAHTEAWSSVGLERPPEQEILNLIGLPLQKTMELLAPREEPQPLVDAYRRAYSRTAPQYETLVEGIETLLQRPFRAAVATGKSQNGAETAVKRHGLWDRFEVVFGGNSVPRPKPHPDLLYAIMEKTGTRELIMIGDTTYDLEMAASAGVEGIGVSWGHHSPERLRSWAPVVDTVAELQLRLGV